MPEAMPNMLESYRTAAASNPNSAEAQSNLGWGYYGQRQYPDSIKVFQLAISLDMNLTDAHYGLGLAFKESGATAQAAAEFEIVTNLAPQDKDAVRGRMLVRLAHGHINQINSGDWSLDHETKVKKVV